MTNSIILSHVDGETTETTTTARVEEFSVTIEEVIVSKFDNRKIENKIFLMPVEVERLYGALKGFQVPVPTV